MRIVLGLGNPGVRYRCTRHNIGFRVVDRLAERWGARLRVDVEAARRAWTARTESGATPVLLAKPRTYMNRSGRAAIALCRRYSVPAHDLLLVHDDADLPLGRIRIRPGGSAGGHRGVQSLIEVLATSEFPRIRIGVRGATRGEGDLADYVLEPWDADEEATVEAVVDLAADAVERVLEAGVTEAMDRFNGRIVAPGTKAADEEERRGPETD